MSDQEAIEAALRHANLHPKVGGRDVSCVVPPFCDGDLGDKLIFRHHPATGELVEIFVGPAAME